MSGRSGEAVIINARMPVAVRHRHRRPAPRRQKQRLDDTQSATAIPFRIRAKLTHTIDRHRVKESVSSFGISGYERR